MFKKTLIPLVSALILGSTIFSLTVFAEDGFPDVDEKNPYKTAIEYLKTNEVIKGYPDGSFKPANTVNRAELLKILIEGGGYDALDPAEACFPDVPKGEWFSKYVCLAKEKGWVQGYPDGYFRPEKTVNKVETLKIMGEVQGWTFEGADKSEFTDADYSDWYGPYLKYAEAKGLLPESGKSGFFSPNAGMSRAAVAENIFRSIAVKQLKKGKFTEDAVKDIVAEKIIPITELIKPKVVINEAQYGYNDPGWVEIYNAGNETIDLKGWSLTNGEAQKFATFPELSLPPNAYLVIYLGHGANDLYLDDGAGSYYLDRDTGVFAYEQDSIALFDNENPSSNSLVDFVAYCNAEECSKGIAYNMALSAEKWFADNHASIFYSTGESLTIGRDMHSTDTDSASDWAYAGGINSSKPTPGIRNYSADEGEEDFDEISLLPYNEDTNAFFNMDYDEEDIIASTGILFAKEKCDHVDVLKEALKMLKKSCLPEEQTDISESIRGINPDNLTGVEAGKDKKFKKVALNDKIEVQLGKRDSGKKGQAYPPETIDGKVIIQINLNEVDCDPEKMKAVLFHELVHEKQFRERGTGIWTKDNPLTAEEEPPERVQPPSTNKHHGFNTVDPLIMIIDCMEVEAHLLTASCLQKEKLLPEFEKHAKSIEKMLDASKKLAEQHWKDGPKKGRLDPYRKGCGVYLKQIIEDRNPQNWKKITNIEWLAENILIKQYVMKWIDKIQALSTILYEKYYLIDESWPESKKNKMKKRFKFFLVNELFYMPEEVDTLVDDIIEAWKEYQDSLKQDDADESDAEPEDEDEANNKDLNQLPVVLISPASPTCETGEIIYISGENSYDPDGLIAELRWYLGDGTLYSTNSTIGFECLDPGLQSMELRVTGTLGDTSSKTFTITISQAEPEPAPIPEPEPAPEPAENQAPVAAIYPAEPTCNSGDTLAINASESYDADGTIETWEWYMGDLLYTTGQSIEYNCMMPGMTESVELRLTDNEGLSTNHSFSITIN